ncbi:MAG: hypothetical protein HQM00_04240 [Magnetococcales bacterium]|nr:hypothetical protein [Magnetococcales bacterium]
MSRLNVKISGKSKKSERAERKDKKISKKNGNQDLNLVRPSSGKETAIVGVPISQ